MKKKNRGCLFLIVGTLGIMLGVAAYILLVGRLTSALTEARFGGTAAYAIMTAQIPCIIAAFLCMDAILILQYLPSAEDMPQETRSGPVGRKKSHSFSLGSRRLTNLVSLILLGGVLICGAVSVNCYRVVDEHGITTHIFVDTATYAWEDVTSYRIDCDSDKGLSVTYTMTDGKKIEVVQGTISDTSDFSSTYGSPVAFAVHIHERMQTASIPRNVSHMERALKFYRDAYPDMWPHVKVLIGYEEITPWEDEKMPETDVSATVDSTAAEIP